MILVHDAARPLVTDEVVERVLAPLAEGWDGAVPGLPVGDTLKRVAPDGGVEETVARDGLWAVQTPQAFAADTFRRALLSDNLSQATDCAGACRSGGRSREGGRRRSASPQGHDRRRSRQNRVVAVTTVVFDVGETLVDEEATYARWEAEGRTEGIPFTDQDLHARRLAVPRRAAGARATARSGGEHARVARGFPSPARRLRRLVASAGASRNRRQASSRMSSKKRACRPTRSRTSATASTTTSCPRSPRV